MRKRTAVLVNRERVQHLRAPEHIRHAELRKKIIQKAQIELRVVCNDQRPLAEHPGKHLRRLPFGNSIVQQHPLGNARELDDLIGQMPPLGEPDELVHRLQLAEPIYILPSLQNGQLNDLVFSARNAGRLRVEHQHRIIRFKNMVQHMFPPKFSSPIVAHPAAIFESLEKKCRASVPRDALNFLQFEAVFLLRIRVLFPVDRL